MPSKIDNRHKQIGGKHRALSRYYMILYRIENTHKSKNLKYSGIEIRITKDDFISWFMENDFQGCSVDRIDSNGHYEIGNIRLIPLAANIIKDKLKVKNGLMCCYKCKIWKPLDEMTKDCRRMATGRSNICKPCESVRGQIKYARKKLK